jgi:hypothetical protein
LYITHKHVWHLSTVLFTSPRQLISASIESAINNQKHNLAPSTSSQSIRFIGQVVVD